MKPYRSHTYAIRRDPAGGHWFDIHDNAGRLQHSSWANESARASERAAKQTIDAMQAANERQEAEAA